MFSSLCATTSLVLFLVSGVRGHGYVHNVICNGQSYRGWFPFDDPTKNPVPDTIVRHVQSDGFVGNGDSDLPCHHGGREGTRIVADADAGSKVTFQWQYWPGDHIGPVSTYMASCNGNCSSFDVTGARWFKIDAAGYDNGQWASAKLIADGASWTSTIPAGLAPGQYLMRHEIIALHSAGSPQFYPSYAQVNVLGTGNGVPADQDLVPIPGLYDHVTFPNIYTDFGSFTIPGPPPVTFSYGGENTSPTSSVTPTLSTGAGLNDSTPTATVVPSSLPASHCKLASRKFVRQGFLSFRH